MYENEEWRRIEEFPHYYVSSYGRVRHENRTEPRKITINERGFPVILLSSATSPTRYLRQVNKLVAKAFLRPPLYDEYTAVWHKDGDLSNCHYENLMWERRDRVLEWNEMHRSGPLFNTPPVKNNRTGEIYKDAFDCAIHENELESVIVWKIEKQSSSLYDENARYRYVPDAEVERGLS
jgi:hypothetical protein